MSAEDEADVGDDAPGEVGSIRPNDTDGEGEVASEQFQKRDGPGGIIPVGRRDQEHHWEKGVAADEHMDLVSEPLGEMPGGIQVLSGEGVDQGGIQNQVLTTDDTATDQLPNEGTEGNEVDCQAQLVATAVELADADGAGRVVPTGSGECRPAGKTIGHLVGAELPDRHYDHHDQNRFICIGWGPPTSTR